MPVINFNINSNSAQINEIFVDNSKVEKDNKLNDLLSKLNNAPSEVNNELKIPNESENKSSLNFYYQNSNLIGQNNNEKIVLCNDTKNFDYERVYGKDEKAKDSFGFVKDLLKK